MKDFNHFQLISIKNPIFNVPLNIFLFNNWKKSNACRFLNSYAFKWYDVRRLKKIFTGSNFVQKFGPSYKKRRPSDFRRAWIRLNTRTIFLPEEIPTSDPSASWALAPFLDCLNHSAGQGSTKIWKFRVQLILALSIDEPQK